MSTNFLIRFDDICSTMNWPVWFEIEKVLRSHEIKPIMAVVPNNADPLLAVAAPRVDFWGHVRAWQDRGWTIGMHGYQHRHNTCDPGLLKLNKWSEFAGLPYAEQEDKIQKALTIFEQEKVRPDLWVAPAHSFDEVTLAILHKYNIRTISDGHSLFPYRDRNGVFWIPQQIWRFYPLPIGIWTICLHHNYWKDSDLERFCKKLAGYKHKFTAVNSVINDFALRGKGRGDQLSQWLIRNLIQLKRRG
jgi:predicted deacetylase